MSYVTVLKCVTCGKEFRADEVEYICEECGPIFGTLDVFYDYDVVKQKLTREVLALRDDNSHFRYKEVLPVPQDMAPGLRVGWTPLYEMKEKPDGVRVFLKDDGLNPTASLKDRASSVAVMRALMRGDRIVAAASSGNAACSLAGLSAEAGLEAYIFVPDRIPEAKLAQLLIYGAKVFRVRGDYDQAYDLSIEVARKHGFYIRSTAYNPHLGEGKKTAALEICEQMNWDIPDKVLVPTGDGCILQGMWKGFQDFQRIGLIDRLPQMIGVQATGAAPLLKAFQEGKDHSEPMKADTIADSICVGVPRDQVKALRAVRESGGTFVSVSDEEILRAMEELAQNTGVFTEPAGASSMAGFKRLLEDGRIRAGEKVALLCSGNGLKDVKSAMEAVSGEAYDVEPELEAVERLLRK
jgi:threonine synthase